jgi:glutaredoxin-like YruB-family protein
MDQKHVVIYSTPTCTYCRAAKDFFQQHGIQYEEHNVAQDIARRQEMIEKSGQMGVPVITIDDKMIIGFDEDHLAEALGIK